MTLLLPWKTGLDHLLEHPWPVEDVQRHEARPLDALDRLLFHGRTPGSYLLGLLLGLGVILYMLYSIKRGYILGRLERRGYKHISRKQEPLSFWTAVISGMVLGSVVVAVCVVALWKGGNAS